MPVSPADFALWARATGNKYPQTAQEKLAAAPHAYEFVKNIGKSGSSAPSGRVGGSILYDQPVSVQNTAPNSLFNSPVTPDNAAPKVAGTLDSTLTSEHFQNQEEENVEKRQQQHSLLSTVGKVALGAGALAAGYALTQTPGGQQAVSNASTFVKENARNIGERTSSFLRGLGGGRQVDPDVVEASGDVTPQTTAQRYSQQVVPVQVHEIQAAKGALPGDVRKLYLPPTSESYSPKEVTETEALASSQTSGPRPSKADVIASVLAKYPRPTQQRGPSGRFMPIPAEEEYTPEYIHPASVRGAEYERTFRYMPKSLAAARRAIFLGKENPLAGAPIIDRDTGEIRNPELSVPGYSEAFPSVGQRASELINTVQETSEQTAALDPAVSSGPSTFNIVPSRGGQYDVLGMREGMRNMGTARLPHEPGWLGNPYKAVDAGGRYTREEATRLFGEMVEKKAQDPAWREAFLGLAGKNVGYYKPNEDVIHLHALQDWMQRQAEPSVSVSEQTAQLAPANVGERVQSFLNEPTVTGGNTLTYTTYPKQSLLGGEIGSFQYDPTGKLPIAESGAFKRLYYGGSKYGIGGKGIVVAPEPELSGFVSNPVVDALQHTVTVPRPIPQRGTVVKIQNAEQGYTQPSMVRRSLPFVIPFEEATPNRALIPGTFRFAQTPAGGTAGITDPRRFTTLPGPRDVEAALATAEAQGVYPEGRYSSLATGQEYEPAYGATSAIDPGVMTSGLPPSQARVELLRALQKGGAGEQLEHMKKGTKNISDVGARGRTETFLKQIHGLYDLTQDPNVLESGAQTAMPLNVVLPGGEIAATKTFFRPFGAVEAMPGSAAPDLFMGEGDIGLTRQQALDARLIEKGQQLNAAKLEAYSILGIDPTQESQVDDPDRYISYKTSPVEHARLGPGGSIISEGKKVKVERGLPDLSEEQFNQLPESTQNRLINAHQQFADTRDKLTLAADFPIRYTFDRSLLEGTKMAPVFGSNTDPNNLEGEVIGFKPVPEEEARTPLERFTHELNKGMSRVDVGGVGRRREELQAETGMEFDPQSLSSPEAVMYKNVDTGEYIHPEEFNVMDAITGRVRAVTGKTASAQRLLGLPDRPYRGLEAVNLASFDPGVVEAAREAHPERVSNEGLIYTPTSMKSPGGGSRPSMGTRFDRNRVSPAPPGSARAQRMAALKAAEQASKQVSAEGAPGTYAVHVNDPETTAWRRRILGYGPQDAIKDKDEVEERIVPTAPLSQQAAAVLFRPVPKRATSPEADWLADYYPRQLETGLMPGPATPRQRLNRIKSNEQLQATAKDLVAKYTGRSLQSALRGAMEQQLGLF